ncbi:MAG: DUF1186 domain-containing protein [Acetobacteraceae bacterium]
MAIDDVIDTFARDDHILPEDAIRWCRAHWDEAGPRFLAMLADYVSGADRSDRAGTALSMGLYLMAEQRETRAYDPLCRLLLDPELPELLLGDGVTEDLHGLLIGVFDGNPAPLQQIIDDAEAGEFVRSAALESLAWLARSGALPDFDMHAYLLHLFEAMRPRTASMIWPAWAAAVAAMGYADMSRQVRQAFSRGSITSDFMDFAHFEADLRKTEDDPTGLAVLREFGVKTIDDVIELMSGWWYYSEDARRAAATEKAAEDVVATRPPLFDLNGAPPPAARAKVGRNDPCPCGSGRKYKKCCLMAA